MIILLKLLFFNNYFIMWFLDSLKDFWNKTKQTLNNAINYSAEKISESSVFSIKNKQDLEDLIKKSETTEFQNKETWEIKYFKHKSILIIDDEKSDFYKNISLMFPILKTKAFSQNLNIMLSKSNIDWINFEEDFWIKELPIMIVFQDKEIYKKIIWKENIEKISKSFKMNIEEQIEQF